MGFIQHRVLTERSIVKGRGINAGGFLPAFYAAKALDRLRVTNKLGGVCRGCFSPCKPALRRENKPLHGGALVGWFLVCSCLCQSGLISPTLAVLRFVKICLEYDCQLVQKSWEFCSISLGRCSMNFYI